MTTWFAVEFVTANVFKVEAHLLSPPSFPFSWAQKEKAVLGKVPRAVWCPGTKRVLLMCWECDSCWCLYCILWFPPSFQSLCFGTGPRAVWEQEYLFGEMSFFFLLEQHREIFTKQMILVKTHHFLSIRIFHVDFCISNKKKPKYFEKDYPEVKEKHCIFKTDCEILK